MKQKSIYLALALAAALALGAMVGCSSQPASQASASSDSASASSQAAEKSQDEIFAELKDSLANVPSFQSVTVVEKTLTWDTYDPEAATESTGAPEAPGTEEITSKTVYQFDESGDQPKTSALFEMADIKLQYYTDGNNAVCVTDGPVYSGTVEQFGIQHAAGFDAYLKGTIGDLNTIVDCAESVTQDEINGVIGYELTLNPEKYIESDEMLKLGAEAGDPVQEAYVTVGFDKDGRIVWMTETNVYSKVTFSVLLDLTDFDSTVIDPMPEATKTYEEMDADIQQKQAELEQELTADEAEGEGE